jgi:hypothetical protein
MIKNIRLVVLISILFYGFSWGHEADPKEDSSNPLDQKQQVGAVAASAPMPSVSPSPSDPQKDAEAARREESMRRLVEALKRMAEMKRPGAKR